MWFCLRSTWCARHAGRIAWGDLTSPFSKFLNAICHCQRRSLTSRTRQNAKRLLWPATQRLLTTFLNILTWLFNTASPWHCQIKLFNQVYRYTCMYVRLIQTYKEIVRLDAALLFCANSASLYSLCLMSGFALVHTYFLLVPGCARGGQCGHTEFNRQRYKVSQWSSRGFAVSSQSNVAWAWFVRLYSWLCESYLYL